MAEIDKKREEMQKFMALYLRQRFTTDEMPENECDTEVEFIMNYLHSQGVVIKRDYKISHSTPMSAGTELVAVEPLIGKDADILV
ncbi:hypothetical protein LCGC14_1963100 [marine sediment metagenome]|uniref:Uncharacterized protein n=1 Tax=marine sediment metagenome TaxID=412755 RepID=A0A0F9IB41_9ZZZZ